MPGDELLPPAGYTWWVPAVGAVLLLAVAAWYAWVLWRTRADADRADAPVMTLTMRERYDQEVVVRYQQYRDGALDLRGLHLELARTMRDFASRRLGTDVRSWTRGDIAGYDPTRQLGDLLARWEEPSFAVRSDAEAADSARGAREVIRTW